MRKNQQYIDWKKELQIWEATTTVLGVDRKIQAGLLFESLEGSPRETVRSELSVAEITSDNGVSKIIETLDEFFIGNEVQNAFSAIEDLLQYKCKKTSFSNQGTNKFKMNTKDRFGHVRACSFCKCLYHWLADCPYAPGAKSKQYKGYSKPLWLDHDNLNSHDVTLYTDCDNVQLSLILGDTLGHAIVDTGCPCTVAGEEWFQSYITTLGRKDRLSIKTKNSKNCFCFGDGNYYRALCNVVIPIYVSQTRYYLRVDIVKCTIPLLLSRDTLKRAKAKIDIETATICFLGNNVPLVTSSSGHLCLPISRSLDATNQESRKVLSRVLFTSPIQGVGLDLKNKARKLHLQFCHPPADRLIDLVRKAGTSDQAVFDVIREVTSQCNVCIKNKKPSLKPAVSFPLANSFNEVVALDLKSFGPEGYILHIVDHLTRYSSACIIKNKQKETIVKGLIKYWIRIFGCPKYFLSDNSEQFVNSEVIDLAEKYNITLKTTAAESPWSNRLCVRHNSILNKSVNKIMANGVCFVETAVHWLLL